MKKTFPLIFLSILLFTACSPAKATPKTDVNVETAVAELMQQTADAAPSEAPVEAQPIVIEETPATVPASNLTLETALVQPGDLPAGIEAQEILTTLDERFTDFPPALVAYRQNFDRQLDKKNVGSINFFQYNSPAEAEQVYNLILERTGDNWNPAPQIGEKSMIVFKSTQILDYYFTSGDVVFTRCNTVTYIRLEYRTEAFDETGSEIRTYAQKVDERLKALVCNP